MRKPRLLIIVKMKHLDLAILIILEDEGSSEVEIKRLEENNIFRDVRNFNASSFAMQR